MRHDDLGLQPNRVIAKPGKKIRTDISLAAAINPQLAELMAAGRHIEDADPT